MPRGRHRLRAPVTTGAFWRVGIRALLPGSAANLAVQGLMLLLGLFTSVVTARVLGPSKRGELAFLVLIPAMLTVVGSLGTEYGVYYFWLQEEGRFRSGLLATCAAVSLVSGAAFGSLGYVVVALIEPQTGLLLRLLVGLSMPLAVANAILTMALMGSGRTRRYNASRLAGPGMFTCTIGALWVARDIGVASAYLSWFGSMVVTALTDIAMMFGLGTGKPRWDVRTARQSVAYGLRSCVGSSAQYGTLRLDQTMLAALAGNGALGLYYAAVSIGETLLYLASNIGAAMLGQFGGRSKAERRHLAVVTMAVVMIGSAAAAGLLILFGGKAIDLLFGKAYLPGLTALRILLPGLIPLALAQVMSGYFIAIGEARVFARAAMMALIATVVGNILLIPAYQAAGAAIASSLAYLLMALWMAWAFLTDCRASPDSLPVGQNHDTVPA
jgi:O-antigen/teichoic acid export membrane protein